jgi:hypothetical protein
MMITTSDLEGLNSTRHRKFLMTTPISYDAIAKALQLPAGWTIIRVEDMHRDGAVAFKVMTTSTKDVAEGTPIPEVVPGQAEWNL